MLFIQDARWSGAALYQGMASAMPKGIASKDGFSRWFGRQGLKALIALDASSGTTEVVP